MGKLIAVWGAPWSGRTSISVKLAETLYARSRGKCAVIVVFADVTTPALPVVFPNVRSDEIYSIGTVLSKPDILPDDVVANLVMVKGRMNLGFMGYREGDNLHSYPGYTKEKAKQLYEVLTRIADYVIVDCTPLPDDDLLTEVALAYADETVRIATPDLKCISYHMSQLKLFASHGYLKETDILVMNLPRQELNLSAADARAHLGKIAFSIPYSSALAEQYMGGNMYEPTRDKRFNEVMRAIAERLV